MNETKVCPIVISSEDFHQSICQNYSTGQIAERQYFDTVSRYSATALSQPTEIKNGICAYTNLKTSIPFKNLTSYSTKYVWK
jgi:hypothetical protein